MSELVVILAGIVLAAFAGSLWIRSRVRISALEQPVQSATRTLPVDGSLAAVHEARPVPAEAKPLQARLAALGYRALSQYRLAGAPDLWLRGFINAATNTMAVVFVHPLACGVDMLRVHENRQIVAISGGAFDQKLLMATAPYPRLVHEYVAFDPHSSAEIARGIDRMHERLLALTPASPAVRVSETVLDAALNLSYGNAVHWRAFATPLC